MKMELDKSELITLIKGTHIELGAVLNELKKHVTYDDYRGQIYWNKTDLNKLSEWELSNLYNSIKLLNLKYQRGS